VFLLRYYCGVFESGWSYEKNIFFWLIQFFLCFVDWASLYNLVNKANLVLSFSYYVYFFSLHVSGDYVPIIRRNNCIYAALGICHSVWIIVWYAGWHETSDKYQVSHRYSYFSWWWAHNCPKHVEKRNKHTKKKIVHQVGFFQKTKFFVRTESGISGPNPTFYLII
jgi:hypothetical protein